MQSAGFGQMEMQSSGDNCHRTSIQNLQIHRSIAWPTSVTKTAIY